MKESNSQALAMFHAYLDDQLSPSARAQFETISEKNPTLQKQLSQQQIIRQQIRMRYLEPPNDENSLKRLRTFVEMYGNDAPQPSVSAVSNSQTRTVAEIGDVSASTITQEIVLEDRDTSGSWHFKVDQFANNRLSSFADSMHSLASSPKRFLPKQLIPQHWIKPLTVGLVLSLVFFFGILFGSGGESKNSANSVLSAIELLALDAHRIYAAEQNHAVEVSATELPKLMEWLSTRLQTQVGPAKLEQQGYTLMGGRLLPSLRKHAAMYMYQDANDKRLSIIMRRNPSEEMVLSCQQRSDLGLCQWADKQLVYFVIADMSIRQLKPLARMAQGQIHSRPR